MQRDGTWSEVHALQGLKEKYALRSRVDTTNQQPTSDAWRELCISHPRIASSYQFYNISFDVLLMLKDDVMVLREHVTTMLEIVLDCLPPAIVDVKYLQYLSQVMNLTVPDKIYYFFREEDDILIEPNFYKLLETCLKVWTATMKVKPGELNKTLSFYLFKNQEKLIVDTIRKFIYMIDLLLNSTRATSTDEITRADLLSVDADFGISYQVSGDDASLLSTITEVLVMMEWIFLHFEDRFHDAFTDAERFYMVLILRGIFNTSTQSSTEGTATINRSDDFDRLTPLAIIASLERIPCKEMNSNQFINLLDIQMSDLPRMFLEVQLRHLVSQIVTNTDQVSRRDFEFWNSSYCRKLIRLAVAFQSRLPKEQTDYLTSFFNILPNFAPFEATASADETLKMLEFYCVIIKYWESIQSFDYEMLRRMLEMVMNAWEIHNHLLIRDPMEGTGRYIVLCDAITCSVSLVSRLHEHNASIEPLATNLEKHFMKTVLFEVWHAVVKAGSKRLDISETTVLKVIQCVCDSLHVLLARSSAQPVKVSQLVSFLVQMTQTNVKRITKHNLAGLIDDSLWIFTKTQKGLGSLNIQTKASFRTFLKYCCDHIPMTIPNRPAYERALEFLDQNRCRDLGSGMKMVRRPRAEVELPVIPRRSTATATSSSSSNNNTTSTNAQDTPNSNNTQRASSVRIEVSNVEAGLPQQQSKRLDAMNQPRREPLEKTTSTPIKPHISQNRTDTITSTTYDYSLDDDDDDDDELLIESSATRKRRTCTPRSNSSLSGWGYDSFDNSSSLAVFAEMDFTPIDVQLLKKRKLEDSFVAVATPNTTTTTEETAVQKYAYLDRAMIVDQLLSSDIDTIKQGLQFATDLCCDANKVQQLVSSSSFFVALRIVLSSEEHGARPDICSAAFELVTKLLESCAGNASVTQLLLKFDILKLLVSRMVSTGGNDSIPLLDVILTFSREQHMFAAFLALLPDIADIVKTYLETTFRVQSVPIADINVVIAKMEKLVVAMLKTDVGSEMMQQLGIEEICMKRLSEIAQLMQSGFTHTVMSLCGVISLIDAEMKRLGRRS